MQLLRFFLFFFYFSVSFYPICMKILSKFRENVGLQAYRLGSVLNRSWTGLRTAVFSGLSQKNREDRDRWSAWTGYSAVQFLVPFRSYEPDLEALSATAISPSLSMGNSNNKVTNITTNTWNRTQQMRLETRLSSIFFIILFLFY